MRNSRRPGAIGTGGVVRFQSVANAFARAASSGISVGPFLARVLHADLLVVGGDFGDVAALQLVGQKVARDADRARRIGHVDRDAAVVGRDLHRGVHARRRRAADQERLLHVEALHLVRDVRHLLERRRDEAGQADDVGVVLERGVEDLLRRHHDAEVDDLEVVALEDDADDVLADVVHVALDRRHHDRALRLAGVARRRLLRLDERHEVPDRLLHHARGLHDLRQEHLAGAEEIADDVHARHQRTFDHLDRARVLAAAPPRCPR